MLTSADPLPSVPRRILVAGTSGSGKTTLAGRISDIARAPHTEIDGLFHGPGWTRRPEFEDDVDSLIAQDAWVTEWQYGMVRKRLAASADLLVWLDLPFWRVVLPRVVRRTVLRSLRHQELWNGNVEPPLWTFVTDRGHIIRWSVATRHKLRGTIPVAERVHPNLTVVRLRTPAQVGSWLRGPLRDAVRP